jgi:hypothetical protein
MILPTVYHALARGVKLPCIDMHFGGVFMGERPATEDERARTNIEWVAVIRERPAESGQKGGHGHERSHCSP